LVDAIEKAGLKPRLVQAFAAKRMLGTGKKTDVSRDEGAFRLPN
jgi:hypothetical protein